MPAVPDWPGGDDFHRFFCRAQRRRWTIHPHRIAERAGVRPAEFMNWESGHWDAPLGFRLMIYASLRQVVAEHALRILQHLEDARPHAEERLAYEVIAAEHRARGERPPRPPLPPVPKGLPELPVFLA